MKTQTKAVTAVTLKKPQVMPVLFGLFFVSGFTALLYQVAWQRMLGLFSGSDVRSVTVIIASYLLGLGIGNLISSNFSDRLSHRQCVQVYGICNLTIAIFAVASRFLFYDLLFLRLQYLAESPLLMLGIIFMSLLIPTTLMGLSLPLLSQAINHSVEEAASSIGWLYGINTLGSGLGTFISGWFIVGTLGYEGTVYLGAIFSAFVGLIALTISKQFTPHVLSIKEEDSISDPIQKQNKATSIKAWYLLVFCSGFTAISWEIIWFRVLDIALQSNAYTYAHLLTFILIGDGLGSLLGAKLIRYIRKPKTVFLLIQGIIALYSTLAIWLTATYWQTHPELRSNIGYIDINNIDFTIIFKYLISPSVLIILPSLLLGFYFPVVQKAVQTDSNLVGKRVGLILLFNILGNTIGSLVTGLVLLNSLGTTGTIKLLCCIGLGFILAIRPHWTKAKFASILTVILVITLIIFPNNTQLWAALQAVDKEAYFIVAEDSTSVAAIAETDGKGMLFASGQVQANFPYMHVHGLLGSVPALLHPEPTNIMIIGLGSGGTPHTIGVNPKTNKVKVVELLGAELPVLTEYSKTQLGKPLQYLLQNPLYEIVVGDGRRELVLTEEKFDIIEADAIQPWRSRAGMLYSQEFFREVRTKLKPGGFFVEWNVGAGTRETMQSVFPYVANIGFGNKLWILVGSDSPIEFNKSKIIAKLNLPHVINFLATAGIDITKIREDVKAASVTLYSQAKDGIPPQKQINTDLFPRGEYYLNSSWN
ncbi:MAG: fused MFS/spermidine synthase [Microcoleaceae cyanobacterium]